MKEALLKQSIIVFGATGRVGQEVCFSLAQQGAKIVVVYNKNAKKAESIVKQIVEDGGEAMSISTDATKTEEVKKTYEKINEKWGKIDGLVNLVHRDKEFEPSLIADMTWENWNPHIEAIKSNFNICSQVIPYMRSKNYGRIVYLSGGLCYRFFEGCAPFSTVKAGINAFCKTLALEEGKYNITVNIVAPGKIEQMNEKKQCSQQCTKEWEDLEERQLDATPIKRHACSKDVSNAILMFLLPENSCLTGQTLFVAGGEIMPMP